MAERIDVYFEVEILGDPQQCIGWGSHTPRRGGGFDSAFAKLLWPLVKCLHGLYMGTYELCVFRLNEDILEVRVTARPLRQQPTRASSSSSSTQLRDDSTL